MKKIKHSSGRELIINFWFFGWWGSVYAPTDIAGTWSHEKVRPRWYWLAKRLCLFVSLATSKYEDSYIGLPLAWDISQLAEGISV